MDKEMLEKLNEFADRMDNMSSLVEELEVRSEDERGYVWGVEYALWGDGLDELKKLTNDFIDFVEKVTGGRK